jgi:hypothetical protein
MKSKDRDKARRLSARVPRVTRRKPFKLSRLRGPKGEGVMPHMREPTVAELRHLRARLHDHADKLPPQLHAELDWLIFWAGWQIDRPWTPDRIQYQRYSLVLEGYRAAVRKGLKTGLWKFARGYAVEKLAGSPAECGDEMMRKSFEAERDATYE